MWNFKPLNAHLQTPPKFYLVKHTEIGDMIPRNGYLCKVDISDAYNHLWPHNSLPCFAINTANHRPLYLRSMGFGASWSPYLWVRLIRSVLKPLKQMGITVLDYLDDLLITGQTKEEARLKAQLVVAHLQAAELLIKEEPNQTITFLGFQWDTKTMTVTLPEQKRLKIPLQTKKMLHRKMITIRNISSKHSDRE